VSGTVEFWRGTQVAEFEDRQWVPLESYVRLRDALDEIAKQADSEYSQEHLILVWIARKALQTDVARAAGQTPETRA